MSIVIELTLHDHADTNKLKELVIEFVKLAPPIFKSFNIRYLPNEVNTGISRKIDLDQFDESTRNTFCTTCFMEEEKENEFALKRSAATLDDSYHTDLHSNKTCYLDCEYNASKISKTMDKSGTFPQSELTLESTPFITLYESKKLNGDEEIKNSKETEPLNNGSVTPQNNGASFNSKKSPQVTSGFIMEQQISSFNPSPEDDVESNEAIDDSSFDRSSLHEFKEYSERQTEDGVALLPDYCVSSSPLQEDVNVNNLVDVLAAAKRGDLTIDMEKANESYVEPAICDDSELGDSKTGDLHGLYEQLNMDNVGEVRKRRVFWKRVKCQLCPSKNFTSFDEAITHVLSQHCDQKLARIYRCRLCSVTSFYKRNLRKGHIKKKHNLQYKRSFSCSIVEEKWHPSTLLETLKASKLVFPKIWPIFERFLVWVVKSGKLDYDALKTFLH